MLNTFKFFVIFPSTGLKGVKILDNYSFRIFPALSVLKPQNFNLGNDRVKITIGNNFFFTFFC